MSGAGRPDVKILIYAHRTEARYAEWEAGLWNLCHVLGDDGISCHEYVTALIYRLYTAQSRPAHVRAGCAEARVA